MEQLNSMFSRMKRGIWSGGDSNQPAEKQQHLDNNNLPVTDIVEDDGFLVIGESEAQNLTQDQQGNSQGLFEGDRKFTMFATCNPTPIASEPSPDEAGEAHCITFHPAIKGVPFELNPKLQEKDRLQNMLVSLDLDLKRMDWQKYDYDFEFDRSTLKELYAMSETSSPVRCSNSNTSFHQCER